MSDHRQAPREVTLTNALVEDGVRALCHAGSDHDPLIRYALHVAAADCDAFESPTPADTYAVAFVLADDHLETLFTSTADEGATAHPAHRLATQVATRGIETVHTPRTVPHDAACYFEDVGLSVTSSDMLARLRTRKSAAECERIASVQAAAGAGIRGGASVLARATVADGQLEVDGTPLTAVALRRAIDTAIIEADAFPVGNTVVRSGATPPTSVLPAAQPIIIAVAPRDRVGYHGGLVRTFVVAGEGGAERRAHIGVIGALRSARALLSADSELTVGTIEADLTAEVSAFGFAPEEVTTRVSGVGLETFERPQAGSDPVEARVGTIVRLEAAVGGVRLAEVCARTDGHAELIGSVSRSLDPSQYHET